MASEIDDNSFLGELSEDNEVDSGGEKSKSLSSDEESLKLPQP
jgi:hypothetical protein